MSKVIINCINTDKEGIIRGLCFEDREGILGLKTSSCNCDKKYLIDKINTARLNHRKVDIECAIGKNVIIVENKWFRTDGKPDGKADLIDLPPCSMPINERNAWIEEKKKQIKK